MFFKDDPEIYVQKCREYGINTDTRSNLWKYINTVDKMGIRDMLENKLDEILGEGRFKANYKNPEINFISEVINRVPMYCNYLSCSNYRNILFVGHFVAGSSGRNWILNNKTIDPDTKFYDDFPPEKADKRYWHDPNIMFQFIPLIMQEYGHSLSGAYLQPNHNRWKGIMHRLYDDLFDDRLVQKLNYKHQYKHGDTLSFDTDNWDGNLFDAVVFLGIPSGEGFDLESVKKGFSKYITDDCHFVDFWYGHDDEYDKRFIGGEDSRIDIERAITEVFYVRSSWDNNVRKRQMSWEYDHMKKMINIYTHKDRELDSYWRISGSWPKYKG